MAAGLVLGTSATVAQVGEALIPAAALFVLVAGGGWRRAVGKTAALCVACALPILAYCTGSYLLAGGFFLSHSGRHVALRPDGGRRRLRHDQAAGRRARAVPDPAQQARGNDWLEFGDVSPVQRYYRDLPRAEVDTPGHQLQPRGADPAAAARARCLRPRRAEAVRGDPAPRPATRPSGAGSSRPRSRTSRRTPRRRSSGPRSAVRRRQAGRLAARRRVPAVLPARRRLHARPAAGAVHGDRPGRLRAPAARGRTRATRQLALACLLFFACRVGALVSDLFVFSWRYQLPALVTLVPAGALGISVIIRWVRTRRRVNPDMRRVAAAGVTPDRRPRRAAAGSWAYRWEPSPGTGRRRAAAGSRLPRRFVRAPGATCVVPRAPRPRYRRWRSAAVQVPDRVTEPLRARGRGGHPAGPRWSSARTWPGWPACRAIRGVEAMHAADGIAAWRWWTLAELEALAHLRHRSRAAPMIAYLKLFEESYALFPRVRDRSRARRPEEDRGGASACPPTSSTIEGAVNR